MTAPTPTETACCGAAKYRDAVDKGVYCAVCDRPICIYRNCGREAHPGRTACKRHYSAGRAR